MADARERRERTGSSRQRDAGGGVLERVRRTGITRQPGAGGAPGSAAGAGGGGMGYESTVDPWWWLDYQKYGTGAEQWGMGFEEQIRQFDLGIEQERQHWEAQYASAIQVAQTYAGGQVSAAEISAAGSVEGAQVAAQSRIRAAEIAAASARYNADTLMKISQLDNAMKLQIAQESNKIEAMKWEATRFQHPSKWAEQEAWFAAGGAPAIETPTRSVVPQLPGATPVGTAAGAQAAGWGTPSALDITAPQAVVGEAGPELATVTPQGMQVSPLGQQQAGLLKRQGVPGMQGGGLVGMTAGQTLGTVLGGRARRSPQQSSFGQISNRLRPAPRATTPLPAPGPVTRTRPYGGTPVTYGAGRPTYGTLSQPGTATPTTPTTPPAVTTGATGGTAAPGGGGGVPAINDVATRSVLSYLRGEEPFPAWGGQELAEFQIPGGANYGTVPLPGQINLVDFLNLPYDMQQMYLSATEATYGMTPQQTSQWMTYMAPRGIASPVAVWG